jgi:hypothetical protein
VMHWMRERSLPIRVLVYAGGLILALALAAGIGALGALIVQGDVARLLEREEPRPADEQNTGRTQQRGGVAEDSAVGRNQAASDRDEGANEQGIVASRREDAEYVGTVGAIQTRAVETFLKSHEKLLQYDALTAEDVEELKANETALQDMDDRAASLAPPRKYEEHHEVFGAAIDELREAGHLAYVMAADPVAATELGFDEYDGHVKEASALLQRSNELLGKDYETIEGLREISPEF